MDISVITPSCRIDALEMVQKCLQKQTFPRNDWEWICGTPFEYKNADVWVKDPGKKEGNFYSLCATYNAMLRVAKGKLIISLQDGIWIEPDTLQHFWDLYQDNSMRCVGAVGDQYEKLDEFGKPTVCCWQDPRRTTKHGEYYEINPVDLEWTLASFPRKSLLDCKGFKQNWDKFAALSEKELNARIDRLGYRFFLDQGLIYRALKHDRLGGVGEWDKKYEEGWKYFEQCIKEINHGEGLEGDLWLESTQEQKNTNE